MVYEILPNLYLGNSIDSQNISNDVELVINCTKYLPFYTVKAECIRIPVDDNQEHNEQVVMYNHWIDGKIFDKIDSTIRKGKNVLIHCQMGQQRSAATIAAYIMYSLRWPLDKTINFVKSKKPDAFFYQINFLLALQHLEKQV